MYNDVSGTHSEVFDEMIFPLQFFVVNAGRAGTAAADGGALLAPIVGFFALFFLEPYYNAFILSIESATGVPGYNPIVPMTLMLIAIAMFIWPIYISSWTGWRKTKRFYPSYFQIMHWVCDAGRVCPVVCFWAIALGVRYLVIER